MAVPDATLLPIVATFLAAGFVKGVIGLGLPTVSLAVLTLAIDLPTAMLPLTSTATVQLVIDDGGLPECWQVPISVFDRNDAEGFTAKGP